MISRPRLLWFKGGAQVGLSTRFDLHWGWKQFLIKAIRTISIIYVPSYVRFYGHALLNRATFLVVQRAHAGFSATASGYRTTIVNQVFLVKQFKEVPCHHQIVWIYIIAKLHQLFKLSTKKINYILTFCLYFDIDPVVGVKYFN